MVTLSRIYTKGGDQGRTSLGDGTRVDEAVCVAALFQAILYKCWKLRRSNMTFRVYPAQLIEENKWRAVRFGFPGVHTRPVNTALCVLVTS